MIRLTFAEDAAQDIEEIYAYIAETMKLQWSTYQSQRYANHGVGVDEPDEDEPCVQVPSIIQPS